MSLVYRASRNLNRRVLNAFPSELVAASIAHKMMRPFDNELQVLGCWLLALRFENSLFDTEDEYIPSALLHKFQLLYTRHALLSVMDDLLLRINMTIPFKTNVRAMYNDLTDETLRVYEPWIFALLYTNFVCLRSGEAWLELLRRVVEHNEEHFLVTVMVTLLEEEVRRMLSDHLQTHPKLCLSPGSAGRRYVRRRFR